MNKEQHQDKQNRQENDEVVAVPGEQDKHEVQVPVTAIIALVLVLGSLAWQAWMFFKPNNQTIYTVDLAAIVKTYQNEAKQQAFKEGVTDEQRAVILQNMQQKMNILQQTIDLYAAECACNIWVQSALVGSGYSDVQNISDDIVRRINHVVQAKPIVPPKTTDTMPPSPLSTPIVPSEQPSGQVKP